MIQTNASRSPTRRILPWVRIWPLSLWSVIWQTNLAVYSRASGIAELIEGSRIFSEEKGLLQSWYDFENQKQEQAVRQWCNENEIELSGG